MMKKILFIFLLFSNYILPISFTKGCDENPVIKIYFDNGATPQSIILQKKSTLLTLDLMLYPNIIKLVINNKLTIQDKSILQSDDSYEILVDPVSKETIIRY